MAIAKIRLRGVLSKLKQINPGDPPHCFRGYIASVDLKSAVDYFDRDDYQRETLSSTALQKVLLAVQGNMLLPEIEVAIRNKVSTALKHVSDDEYEILIDYDAENTVPKRNAEGNPYVETWQRADTTGRHVNLYLIDGGQRISALRQHFDAGRKYHRDLALVIWFSPSLKWERDRFTALGLGQTGIAGNIFARNSAGNYQTVGALLAASRDPQHILGGKVTWSQNRRGHEIVSATVVIRSGLELHKHMVSLPGSGVGKLMLRLEDLSKVSHMSVQQIMHNLAVFYSSYTTVFGFHKLARNMPRWHLSGHYLWAVARFFSLIPDFWTGPNGEVFRPHPKALSRLARFVAKVRAEDLAGRGHPHLRSAMGGLKSMPNVIQDLIEALNKWNRPGDVVYMRRPMKPELTPEPEPEPEEELADEPEEHPKLKVAS